MQQNIEENGERLYIWFSIIRRSGLGGKILIPDLIILDDYFPIIGEPAFKRVSLWWSGIASNNIGMQYVDCYELCPCLSTLEIEDASGESYESYFHH